ncbi:MAG: acyl carrier protein [Clostridiales Family XIII bacterium]|jgi:acyl carrier protein|nr:acyl carrier protein [Clostridiales Family XIII bacterium]
MSVRSEALEIIVQKSAEVLGVDASGLGKETTFESLGFKSANFVMVTTTLEDAFDVEVPFMEFKRNKTFGEAAEYVEELVES